MRVVIVQYDPQLGQVDRNLKHVTEMIAPVSSEDKVDILMLSEMAFTGYVFTTKSEVEEVAEVAGEGKTFKWCQAQALRLRCMVMCGYVERDPASGNLYNAMMVISPAGELVVNPRKTFLYETDKPWATPGDGFITWHCPWLDKTISFGICMDINPDDFKAPFEAYEFGTHAAERGSDLVLFSCAWCDFEPPDADISPTLSYWATRLHPIIEALQEGKYPKDNCYFLCSNRIGSENGTFFVGASCALSLKEPALLATAERREEAVLQIDLP
ncbi:hypothetical protein Poli38472_011294 [Pythium oligandrum]|uniref:CN hydrolase domain-containing protein n=1 Tax=Pythium oligandrum TaxID=41045 RepID=A0A8K1CQC1_PYTOL|nr:hypothetical protein Poli38472_011294 [Pythium oligandrum]|eukprot:TMW67674.1 hypothetical protein Poli38472_011294 [Pythium oligandrum]